MPFTMTEEKKQLRQQVRKELAAHPKVLRIEVGLNPGETDLVLRELY